MLRVIFFMALGFASAQGNAQDICEQRARIAFNQEYNACISGEYTPSPGGPGANGSCPLQNLRCGACVNGNRTCTAIDCRSNFRQFQEECYQRNEYACGACLMQRIGYTYAVYFNNRPISESEPLEDLWNCTSARAVDPRCNGN